MVEYSDSQRDLEVVGSNLSIADALLLHLAHMGTGLPTP